jgi:hypothetical protein
MKLDFAKLSKPVRLHRGQRGTPGTSALVRVSTSPKASPDSLKQGDKPTASTEAHSTCPPLSPEHLLTRGTLKPSTGAMSHLPPSVPPEMGRELNQELCLSEREQLAAPRQVAEETRFNSAQEKRRRDVLSMLAQDPGLQIALVDEHESEPDAVILAVAIRGKGTCELRIRRDRYDGFAVLELLEQLKTTGRVSRIHEE